MIREHRKLFAPILFLFALLNAFFIVFKSWLVKYGIGYEILLIGNVILFTVTLVSLYFHIKGFLHKNIQVFFRSVYAALMVKMFLCAATVVVYALLERKNVNKPAIFICMALYFVYTLTEVGMIFRLLKQQKKNNG